MADKVLNMNILTINKHWCKLKDLCFKTATNHIQTVSNYKNDLELKKNNYDY